MGSIIQSALKCGLCGLLLSCPVSPVQVMFYYPWVSAPIQCQPKRWSQHGGGRGLSCLRANGKEWQESATDNATLGDVRQQIISHILPLPSGSWASASAPLPAQYSGLSNIDSAFLTLHLQAACDPCFDTFYNYSCSSWCTWLLKKTRHCLDSLLFFHPVLPAMISFHSSDPVKIQ